MCGTRPPSLGLSFLYLEEILTESDHSVFQSIRLIAIVDIM